MCFTEINNIINERIAKYSTLDRRRNELKEKNSAVSCKKYAAIVLLIIHNTSVFSLKEDIKNPKESSEALFVVTA